MRTMVRAGVALAVLVSALGPRALSAQPPKTAIAQWRLLPELRVGENETGASYEFTRISQVVSTGDAVFVRQTEQQEIRVFGLTGRFRRTIGRAGGGPGEFKGLWAFGIYADTLWTLDFALRRVSLFATSGKLLKTITFESITPTLGTRGNTFATYPMDRQRDGILLGFGGTTGLAMAAGLVKSFPLLRMSPAGLTTDTLGWVPIAHDNMILRSSHGEAYHTQPFSDAPLTVYAAAMRRIYLVDRRAAESSRASYSVAAIKADGGTVWTRRVEYDPVLMDRHVADSVRNRMYRIFRSQYPQSMIDDSLYIPKYQPPVSDGIVGDDGTIWLRRENWTPAARYDVLDASGTLIAHVETNRSVHLRWVSGTTAWGSELDDNDVPTLVRYRIVKTAAR